jgi:hypothetical protein
MKSEVEASYADGAGANHAFINGRSFITYSPQDHVKDLTNLAHRDQAADHRHPVDEDRAGAALALAAALLGAGEAQVDAQGIEQPQRRAQRSRPDPIGRGSRVGAVSSRPGLLSVACGLFGRVERREDPLRRGRQLVDPHAGRVVDGGDDRRRDHVHRQLAIPLAVRLVGEQVLTRTAVILGASSEVGIRYLESRSLRNRPSFSFISSMVAYPTAWSEPPSTCPAAISGLMTVPQSSAETTCRTP